jgi:hypothetical protein
LRIKSRLRDAQPGESLGWACIGGNDAGPGNQRPLGGVQQVVINCGTKLNRASNPTQMVYPNKFCSLIAACFLIMR